MIYLCYAIMIIVPYLLCGINTAIIVTKIKTGEDIRTLGSGNAGLTNTLRTQGKIAALFVLLGDVLKGTLSILIVRFSFLWLTGTDTANPDNMMTYVGFAAAVAAIIGHVFPIYFGFKGGKAVATAAAVALMMDWRVFLSAFAVFAVVAALTRTASVSSMAASIAVAAMTPVFTKNPVLISLGIFTCLLVLLMHRSNIRRLIQGTEPKFHFGKHPEKE
mgnify:CR=1 FL=1